MNLVIDIGNSSVKTAVFKNTELLDSKLFYSFETDDIKRLLEQYPKITKGIVSVVGKSNYTFEQYLGDHLDYLISLEAETPLPIENLYTTKETLGKDRIAGVTGANFLFPDNFSNSYFTSSDRKSTHPTTPLINSFELANSISHCVSI